MHRNIATYANRGRRGRRKFSRLVPASFFEDSTKDSRASVIGDGESSDDEYGYDEYSDES